MGQLQVPVGWPTAGKTREIGCATTKMPDAKRAGVGLGRMSECGQNPPEQCVNL
jgi:hypothetical protein